MTKYTFYSKSEYYQALVQRLSSTRSGDKVALSSMKFDITKPEIKTIFKELAAAANRGVEVHLVVDAFTFMVHDSTRPGLLFYRRKLPAHHKMPQAFQQRWEALEELRQAGGHFVVTNKPSRRFSNPFGGRNHIKLAVINDYVFVGGCNLSEITELDLMVGWEDTGSADWLLALVDKIEKSEVISTATAGQDLSYRVDGSTTLMVDGGQRRQSAIYQKALQLLREAKDRAIITCQYFPNSRTAEHLKAAHKRGAGVSIYYSHPSKHLPPQNIPQYAVLWLEKLKNPSSLFSKELPKELPKLHAKLIVSDDSTLVGSHNYVPVGVNWGTAEIALLSHDPQFAKSAIAAIEKQIK